MTNLRSLRLLSCALAWLAFAPAVPVSGQLMGPEFRVNSYTTSHQQYPAVAADAAGNFIVVWASQGQDDPDHPGIFAQRYGAAGGVLGDEFQVNSYSTQGQSKPAIAIDGAGMFVVVWESMGQDGSIQGIFGQRFDALGIPAGAEFQVNTYTTAQQQTPAIAVAPTGEFVVTWQSYGQFDPNQGVFARLYNASGVPQGGEFHVNTYTTGWQRDPAVAMNAAGDFVIAWQSYPQDGSLYGIFGQRFSAAGAPQGTEFPVNTVTDNNQVVPSVAADTAGNFVVVWEDKAADGSDYGIFGQRFDAAGSALQGEFRVNTQTFSYQRNPAVARNGAGEFLVSWYSADQDGSLDGIYAQRYHANGSPAAGEFQINTYTTNRQQLPAVAADGQGRFVVAWKSEFQDGSSYGVFGRRIASLVFADGFGSADVCGWSSALGSSDFCP